ncbi:MAG: hypothetical protein IJN07_02690 [Clostridia bacterium]|nr:hypothetical protein [Clostridia bacterium]
MLKRQTVAGAVALGVVGALAVIGTATVTDYLLKLINTIRRHNSGI